MIEEQNVAAQQGYMTLEQQVEAYKYVKQEIHLIDFATDRLGWQVDPAQKDKRGVILNHGDHGKIIVPPSPNAESGDWSFYWADKEGEGNLIHLLEKQGWQWDKIRALKSSSSQEQQVASPKATASKAPEPVHISQASLNKTPVYERTLLEQLEIPQKACQSIKGYEADEKQITFPIYADSQAVKEQKPMGSYQFKLEEKGLVDYTEARGTTPGLVVLPAQRSPDSVVITSNPLDIFLHRAEQQSQTSIWKQWSNPPATTYISTCGQAGKDLQKPLEDILSQHKDTNLVFYMNNNEARDLRIHLGKSVLSDQSKGFAYEVSPPCQSLWHDVSHKESQDTPKVVQEELWEQITPRQRQDKGIKMQ